MKIAIYANLNPQSDSGGVTTYLRALVKALGDLRDGDEEYVLLGPQNDSDWLRAICGPNQQVVEIPRAPRGRGRQVLDRLSRLSSRLLQHRTFAEGGEGHVRHPGPDSGFQSEIPVSNGFIESLEVSLVHFPFQRFVLCSLPSIYNPHDLQHLHLPQFFPVDTIKWRETVYPTACRLSARVAVASNWVATDVCEKYALPRSKVAVIPWGAATASWPAPTSADISRVRATYGLPSLYVFYPAVAWPHKNHSTLIEAIAALNTRGTRVTLVLSGSRSGLSPRLEDLVRKLAVSDLVRFLGHVPGSDMRALYTGATAVVVPTLFEAASGPVAEAWQEGTPAICSDIPQLRAQAEGAARFFDPYDPASIASAIEAVLHNPDVRAALIAAGRERIASLDWRTTALAYRDLYREVGNRSPASSGRT